jgi:hypothetical protein
MDEQADFLSIASSVTGKIRINTRGVTRVSSTGAKAFLIFLGQCSTSGVEVTHEECSPAVVHHLPIIMQLNPSTRVDSVMAPFSCANCRRSFDVLLPQPKIAQIKTLINARPCPSCQKPLKFDEVPQDYFAFLRD